MNRLICLCVLFAGCALAEEIKAYVKLVNIETGSDDAGHLNLVQRNGKLYITGEVHNLVPQGSHGFHVHENGTIANKCLAAGAHYNPLKVEHGAPDSKIRHIGDLGNIEADEKGNAKINITDSIALLNGEHSILNRAVVIHQDKDDLGVGGANDSKKTGHAGARVICGVITDGSVGTSVSLTVLVLALLFYCFQQL